jgi:hypothetical protein
MIDHILLGNRTNTLLSYLKETAVNQFLNNLVVAGRSSLFDILSI